MTTITLRLPDLNCACCADEIERQLRQSPHVTGVHLDFPAGVMHVSYHEGMITFAELQRIVEAVGYECRPADAPADGHRHGQALHAAAPAAVPSATPPTHHADAGAPPQHATSHAGHLAGPSHPTHAQPHLGHRADMLPVTMGTKHDRMQYEAQAMPDAMAQHHHELAREATQAAYTGHGAMDHDMSDPKMAKAMEADMRNRFVVAL